MFELNMHNHQIIKEAPKDTKAIKLLHNNNVIKNLYGTKTKCDKAYIYEDPYYGPTHILPREYQVEELDENIHRNLVEESYGILLDILRYAPDNLPQLQKIEFDSSLKLAFLEHKKLEEIAKNIPQGVNHIYLNDQGFANNYSCRNSILAFFNSLPTNLVTLQVGNMQQYIATAICKGLKIPQNIKHLILTDNKIFKYSKEILSKLFACTGEKFSLDTFEIVNEEVKFSILDILLQHITAQKIVFWVISMVVIIALAQ